MSDKNILNLIDVMKKKIDDYNNKINNEPVFDNDDNNKINNVNEILDKLNKSFIQIKNLINEINNNKLDNIQNNIDDTQIKDLLDDISKYNQELNTLYSQNFDIPTIQN